MNAALPIAPSAREFARATAVHGPTRVRVAQAAAAKRFRRRVLWLVIGCAVPVAVLLALGQLTLAANYFWSVSALMMLCLSFARRHETLLALLIGLLPLSNLLRGLGFAFFNASQIALAAGLLFYAVRSPRAVREVWRRCRLLWGLFVFAAVYYGLSFWMTGTYSRNLRIFELCLSVFAVLLAGRNRYVLGAGLLGMIVSAVAIGTGLLPQNDTIGRLGSAVLEGTVVGNPVQLGLALALGFLVATVDRGRWLALPRGKFWSWVIVVPVSLLLMLTTSRAAWLAAGCGLVLSVLVGQRQRLRMLFVAGLLALATVAVLASPFGPSLRAGLERTFDEERNLGSRTSGRSDQWAVAVQSVTASWDRMLWGYGPGRGPAVYARYSDEVAGVRYAVGREVELHSLFMQVLVEAGLLGAAPVVIWLMVVTGRVVAGTRASHRLLPLVCLGAYIIAILTISGNDTICGTMLGIGLLGTLRPVAWPSPSHAHAMAR